MNEPIAKDAEIERLKALCIRAADALSDWVSALPEHVGEQDKDLIQELRKAAE